MDATILACMFRHAEETPGKVIYTSLERGESLRDTCTYAQLRDRVCAIANALSDLEYEGERALVLYANPVEFVQLFLGCLAAGVIAVPVAVPSRGTASGVAAIARNAGIRCVLAGRREQQLLQESIDDACGPLAWFDLEALSTGSASVASRRVDEIAHSVADRIAFLQFTSGSTGAPKGVMVSHHNLMANEAIIGQAMRMHCDSVVVGWLPHYHDMGLIGNLLQPLYQGAQCVLMQPVDFIQKPLRWLRAISVHGGTTSGGPNFAYDLCVTRSTRSEREGLDLSRWDVAFTGAEPVNHTTIERFIDAFAPHGLRRSVIYPCYGMAESTLFITGAQQGAAAPVITLRTDALTIGNAIERATPGATQAAPYVGCGFTYHDTAMKIVHPETRCPLLAGHVGEIWVRGASVAHGYYNDPEATRHAFGATIEGAPSTPYLRTGDLGVMVDGHLIIVGRLKDVLVVRGRNYYPQDLENTAQQAHSALAPGGGGTFQRAALHDERVVLVHELTRQGLRHADLQEVARSIRAAVIEHHGITVNNIVFVKPGQLPRTTSGKIRRNHCRALFERGDFEAIGIVEQAEV
ncbi:MAG: fatty acyl-AMP ligase [Aquisalimonadaceae bacterium]